MPVGVCITATSKGYVTKQKFHKYGTHFVRYLKTHRILDRPHLLIVDSNKSHIYKVAFFDLMKEMNIHVMAIPHIPATLYRHLTPHPLLSFKNCSKDIWANGTLTLGPKPCQKINSGRYSDQPGAEPWWWWISNQALQKLGCTQWILTQ